MSLASKKIACLQDRALLLQKVRSFFNAQGVLEVDTPLLSHSAPIDEHIDVMEVDLGKTKGYLHTSPEYAMKRLLSLGIGDIFQLSHVFRLEEHGKLHNPEFTMIEWYRIGFSFEELIKETIALTHLFLEDLPAVTYSYKKIFQDHTGLDYTKASREDLLSCALNHGIDLSSNSVWSFDDLLHLLMGSIVEPHLGKNELTVVIDYPSSQAALAQVAQVDGDLVAKRFEVYYQGIELSNGYLELTDAIEQKKRFELSNQKRTLKGKPALPLDYNFLHSLEKGLPSCCGVAVGFDRLLMLRHGLQTISDVLPFGWSEI